MAYDEAVKRAAPIPPEDQARIDALWALTSGRSFVDADKLVVAVARVSSLTLDPRTDELATAARLALQGQDTGHTKFPTLKARMGTVMKKSTIEKFLKDLGSELVEPARIIVGGSSALILFDLLERNTEDIDLVDEIPAPLRTMHQWRENAKERYGLYLAHFQSHYLPRDWENRLVSMGSFRQLTVLLVDPLDILVGKLFSRRVKDQADLDQILPSIPRERFDQRLLYADRLAADESLRQQADKNYYILFGDALPDLRASS